jgi:serine/threonine protein kinase
MILAWKSDFWPLGFLLYEAFTGRSLYESRIPGGIIRRLPSKLPDMFPINPGFVVLVSSCLQIDPRYHPTFARLLQNRAFQSLQPTALRYLNIMLTK